MDLIISEYVKEKIVLRPLNLDVNAKQDDDIVVQNDSMLLVASRTGSGDHMLV